MQNHRGIEIQSPTFCYLSSMYMDIKCFVFQWILKNKKGTHTNYSLPWYGILLFIYFFSVYLSVIVFCCCEYTEFIVLLLYPPHRFLFIHVNIKHTYTHKHISTWRNNANTFYIVMKLYSCLCHYGITL